MEPSVTKILAAYIATPTEQNAERVRRHAKKHPMALCFCINPDEVSALKNLGLA